MRHGSLTALAAALVLVLSISGVAQTAINDLFDRANGTNLGPDWMEVDMDAVISGNKLQGNSPFGFGWSAHTAYGQPYANTVVRLAWSMNGFGGDRISLIAGTSPITWEGIEVRIADNDGDGLADRLFFNAAVNAGTWFGGSLFFNLVNPLVSGEATLWFTNAGDTANIDIYDPATDTSEVFSASGILSNPPTGTTVGIGYFGNGTADDFQAFIGVPTRSTLTLTAPRVGSPLSLLVTNASPFAPYVIASSNTGAGPLPTTIGTLFLSAPISVAAVVFPDLSGRAELPVGIPPAFLAGAVGYLQAVDVGSQSLSNHFMITVF